MAVYSGAIKQRDVRASTITVHGGAGQRGSVKTAALQTSSAIRVNASDVQDPARLVKVVNDLQQAQDDGARASQSNPFSAPSIQRGLTFSPGQVVVVPHQLGRPFTEWHTSRVQGAYPQLVEVAQGSTLYPSQVTPDKVLVVLDTRASGPVSTCNLVVVGD